MSIMQITPVKVTAQLGVRTLANGRQTKGVARVMTVTALESRPGMLALAHGTCKVHGVEQRFAVPVDRISENIAEMPDELADAKATELRGKAQRYRAVAERDRRNGNLTEAAQCERKARQFDEQADEIDPPAAPLQLVEIETQKVATVTGVGIEYVVLATCSAGPTRFLVRSDPGEPDQEPCIEHDADSMTDALTWIGERVDAEIAAEFGAGR